MIVAPIVVLAGALLIAGSRTVVALVAYVVLAVAAGALIAPAAAVAPLALAVFGITLVMKILVAPAVILVFLRTQPAARNLRPSLALPLRLLLAIALGALGAGAVDVANVAAAPQLALALYVVACALAMLLVHRNLLAQLIALLALGTGITLCGAVLAPALPESVELGATFDALVGTFIGLGLIRAVAAVDPLLDVESLKQLRG